MIYHGLSTSSPSDYRCLPSLSNLQWATCNRIKLCGRHTVTIHLVPHRWIGGNPGAIECCSSEARGTRPPFHSAAVIRFHHGVHYGEIQAITGISMMEVGNVLLFIAMACTASLQYQGSCWQQCDVFGLGKAYQSQSAGGLSG